MQHTSLSFLLALAGCLSAQGAFGANNLADSQSPYLIQHADNPVNWYPWGDEAFEKAAAENKLVFVSIGYSTCHWCHVMNRESFADPEVAAYMNEHYVSIKVDREERPDVDAVYLAFVSNLAGSAGWPLNVWLSPDQKPFFGATYYPKETFLQAATQIGQSWQQDPDSILEWSRKYAEALSDSRSGEDSSATLRLGLLEEAVSALFFRFDSASAGFGADEKFPLPDTLRLLLRVSSLSEVDPESRDLARSMAVQSLDRIASSGLRDHVGGGFHRYAVDRDWRVPHFEKMLYDQALLISAYTEGFQLTRDPNYRSAAISAIDYILRDLRSEEGAFYSAEDAESAHPGKPEEKSEGAFYTWTHSEMLELFPSPERRERAMESFAVQPEGNTGKAEFSKRNILRRPASFELQPSLDPGILETLFEARSARPRPHLDDKIIVSWNGLAITALAQASLAFNEPSYSEAASQAASFIFERLYDSSSGRLRRLYRDSASPVPAFAEDYAYLVQGCLSLYESTADHAWLSRAKKLQDTQDELFLDRESGGYFMAEASKSLSFQRPKRSPDSTLPSHSAISAENLSRLAQLYDDKSLLERARDSLVHSLAQSVENPIFGASSLAALPFVVKKPMQVILAGEPDSADMQRMLATASKHYLPYRTLIYADLGPGQDYLGESLEFIRYATAIDGAATAFVCEDFVCQLPTNDLAKLSELLAAD